MAGLSESWTTRMSGSADETEGSGKIYEEG